VYHPPILRRNDELEADQVGEVIGDKENPEVKKELDDSPMMQEEPDRDGKPLCYELPSIR
jgi:hypothetical protein